MKKLILFVILASYIFFPLICYAQENVQHEPKVDIFTLNFSKLVNSADLIAIVVCDYIDYHAKDTAGARLQVKAVIKGKPVANPIWSYFFLPMEGKQNAAFELNKEYLVFMDSGLGDDHYYTVIDPRVRGDLGLVKIVDGMAISRLYPDGSDAPIPLDDYLKAIEKVINETPANLKDRVKNLLEGLKKGLSVSGTRQSLTLTLWHGDTGEAIDDLRDIIHDKTVDYLSPHIKDTNIAVRRGVFELLKQIGSEITIPLLIKGLNDTDVVVKRSSIEGLVKAQAWKAVPALVNAFNEEVTDEEKNKLNENINQSLITIIVQHRYNQWGNIEWHLARSAVFKKEGLPSYLSSDPAEKRLEALNNWKEWLEKRKIEFE